MVDLNVVAMDNRGEAVTDLTRDDFQITDSGKPQAIAFFRHRNDVLRPPPQLGPNEFSNRSAVNVPRATLILFDLLNQKFETRGTTANLLVKELQSLPSADFVYLYLLTVNGTLYPVHGLPGVEGEINPSDGGPWTREAKPLLDQALRNVLRVREPGTLEDVQWRAEMTFVALNKLTNELARVPGRKSIVWLSDGVPIELGPRRSDFGDWVDFTPLLRQISDGMDRSEVAVYPVRSVLIGSASNVDGAQYDGSLSLQTLDMFANMTGGRPDAGKDVGAAVRQAIRDTRTSYQLGYYPPITNWNDKFHKLRIVCKRKGVRVQAKTGYYAWREPPATRSTQAMLSAVNSRFDAAEIGLRATLVPQAGQTFKVEGHIDAQDVALVHQGDAYNGQLRLAVASFVPGMPPNSGPLIPFDIHYTAQERDRVLIQGISFASDLRVNEGTTAIRVIAYDRNSYAIGSITIPIPSSRPRQP